MCVHFIHDVQATYINQHYEAVCYIHSIWRCFRNLFQCDLVAIFLQKLISMCRCF